MSDLNPSVPSIAAAAEQGQSPQVQELKVSGHLMALPPGLYCFINEPTPGATRLGGMPGVRLSPPPLGGQNVEISSYRDDGWLNGDGDAALVRIRNHTGQVLVTVYQLPNLPDAAPRLKVQRLLEEATGPVAPVPAAAPAAPQAPAQPAGPLDVVAHIQSRGDVGAGFGTWVGEPGSNNWIEGFSVHAPEGVDPADLSYQAVLGRGWLSPWVDAGQYCGSRGMALPLLGLRVRLTDEAAERYTLSVEASFVGGAAAGPVGNDETCEAETLAPLEAIKIVLTPRTRKSARSKR